MYLKRVTPGEPFKRERGIRQGDPIFSYIFSICAKYFGKFVHFISTIPRSGIVIEIAKTGHVIPY